MNPARIYVETSVISYLTARPSRDLLVAARQEATREWWERRDRLYLPFVSNLVLQEAACGDPFAARLRLEICHPVARLDIDMATRQLAKQLIQMQAIPTSEPEDALHIALATIAKLDYIATWNFAHLVGPAKKYQLQTRIQSLGFTPPLLATPEELLETLI